MRSERRYALVAAATLWPLLIWGCATTSPTEKVASTDNGRQTPATQATPLEPPIAEPLERAGQRVEYAPGLVIDFARRRVEVAARVVLREGLLELLACSAGTKEHESILVVLPRPLHIYQALGLIGLTPGRPAAWDPEQHHRIPPTGEELAIAVAYERDGRRVEVNAWDWLQSVRTGEPAAPRPWVFAGSLTSPRDGSFAADYDGNVISVVDFGTELIGLAEMFSADNDQLWLQAHTDRIPPLATSCTLILRPAERPGGSMALVAAQ